MEINKRWKRIPFNIELAKDIQSGKVEGRFVTKDSHSVRIICFNKKIYSSVNSYPIVALVDFINFEHPYTFSNSGVCEYIDVKGNYDLYIELPEKTQIVENGDECDFWEKCDKCKLFDGYDLCIAKGNFGAVTDISKENCEKNNLYLPKEQEEINQNYKFKPFNKNIGIR